MPYRHLLTVLVVSVLTLTPLSAATQASDLPSWSVIENQSHALMFAHDDAGASALLEGYYQRCQADDILVGLRDSAVIGEWARIATTYPQARIDALALRDRGAVQLLAGNDIDKIERHHELIRNGLYLDVVAIDDCFGDQQNAINLFFRLDEQKPNLARYCFDAIRFHLLESGHRETCLKYLGDPLQSVQETLRDYDHMVSSYPASYAKSYEADSDKRSLRQDIDFVLRLLAEVKQPLACRQIQTIPELSALFPDWAGHVDRVILQYQDDISLKR